jgi:hypothetical protein
MPNAAIGITYFVAIHDNRDVQKIEFLYPMKANRPLQLCYRKYCKGGSRLSVSSSSALHFCHLCWLKTVRFRTF